MRLGTVLDTDSSHVRVLEATYTVRDAKISK